MVGVRGDKRLYLKSESEPFKDMESRFQLECRIYSARRVRYQFSYPPTASETERRDDGNKGVNTWGESYFVSFPTSHIPRLAISDQATEDFFIAAHWLYSIPHLLSICLTFKKTD